jgi:cobalt/nickel transport system permease protein
MLGWHTLIGIGEAVITALTVSAVVVVRPDLAYAARGLEPTLRLRQADGSMVTVERPNQIRRRSPRSILVAGGLVALVLAGAVSILASGDPDGLEYVAGEEGFAQAARDHLLGDSVLADYGDLAGIPVGVAGVLGVVVTAGAGLAVFRAVSRSRRSGSRMAGR